MLISYINFVYVRIRIFQTISLFCNIPNIFVVIMTYLKYFNENTSFIDYMQSSILLDTKFGTYGALYYIFVYSCP